MITETKLHLGCGEKYLEGYVNIDFPNSEHSVMTPRVDQYADIRTLSYPENSIDEVRSHHLFEHFSRAEALKLLVRWRSWLKPGGRLVIETPDFATSAAFFLRSRSTQRKFQLSRHIYGSQEAGWATHKDNWDKRKFLFVLKKMGFKNIKIRNYNNGLTRHAEKIPRVGKMITRIPESIYLPLFNITGNLLPESFYEKYGSNKMPNILAVAQKDDNHKFDAMKPVTEILSLSLTGKEGENLLSVWIEDYKKF